MTQTQQQVNLRPYDQQVEILKSININEREEDTDYKNIKRLINDQLLNDDFSLVEQKPCNDSLSIEQNEESLNESQASATFLTGKSEYLKNKVESTKNELKQLEEQNKIEFIHSLRMILKNLEQKEESNLGD